MGHVEKLERSTLKMQQAIKTFEKQAKNKPHYLDITREEDAPGGHWYCNDETNKAFFWFLSGTSYGELISR